MSESPLSQEVLRLANRVHGLAAASEDQLTTERIEAEAARWSETTTAVVVAGDITRGKSSLVNAVIGRPGLLPVDVDVATSIHLAVRHGRPEAVRITRIDSGSGETTVQEITPDRLVDHATMAGSEVDRAGVTAAEVLVDLPLLEDGLSLVDTPGVGGTNRGHRDVTMAALQHADALVFVVSAIEPVSRSELEFLTEASERIANVILVATRSDLGTPETNAQMAADVRDRIARLAEQKAAEGDETAAGRLRRLSERDPVLVSNYLAEQAIRRADRGREEQAARLRAESGIDAVVAHLESATRSREDLRLLNILQLVSDSLGTLAEDVAHRRRALDGDPDVSAEIEARTAELKEAAGLQARWRTTLAASISKMQTLVGRDVGRELTAIRDDYRMLLDDPNRQPDLDHLDIQLRQSLQAAWSNLADLATRRFDEVISDLLGDLDIEGREGLLGELTRPPAVTDLRARGSDGGEFDLLDDAVPLATQAFLFGNIANVMVGVLGIATGGLGIMAYGVGAAIASPIVLMRRRQREHRRQAGEVQRLLNEALFGQDGISRELTTELSLRIMEAREELEKLIEDRLVTRRADLEEQHRELQELMRTEASERERARAEIERRGEDLEALRAETIRLTAAVQERIAIPTTD